MSQYLSSAIEPIREKNERMGNFNPVVAILRASEREKFISCSTETGGGGARKGTLCQRGATSFAPARIESNESVEYGHVLHERVWTESRTNEREGRGRGGFATGLEGVR